MVVDNTLDGNTATILANQATQTIYGAMNGHDVFAISTYGDAINGSLAGFDTFRFTALYGSTTINRFVAGDGEGHDIVDLSAIGAAPSDFDDLLHDVTQTAGGAQIKIGGSTITLSGVLASALTSDDFILSGSTPSSPTLTDIAVNQAYHTYNGDPGGGKDRFTVTTYGATINANAGGGNVFVVDNKSRWYDTYNAASSDTMQAGVDGAFIGITGAFNPAYIDLDGHTGVVIGGNSATLICRIRASSTRSARPRRQSWPIKPIRRSTARSKAIRSPSSHTGTL